MQILCKVYIQFTVLLEDEVEVGQQENESEVQARLSKKDGRLVAKDGRSRHWK